MEIIMDYEKLYKEAIEKAKKELRVCGFTNCDAARQIFRLFPELAEFENERMRKYIINHFQEHLDTCTRFISNGMFPPFSAEEIKMFQASIAWLEMQNDKGKIIKDMNNKDDERLRKATISFLKDFANAGYEKAVECIDWLEKQGNKNKV